MPREGPSLETSTDAVLGGRLRLRQPVSGHRVGHDAILLAAATGARAGEHAVDLGAGVGAAGFALAARIGGLKVTLVEIDQVLANLAAENAQANGMGDRVHALACDAEDTGALAAAGLPAASADRVLMNPPFHDARRYNVSPDAGRRLAHAGGPVLLQRWIAAAAFLLKPAGVLTLIWRADELPQVLAALAPAFGDVAVLPVAPREGAAPIRVRVRAVKGGRAGAPAAEPPLILNGAQGRASAAAEAVLRGGEALSLAVG
ncbi:MAG: methyltransferase [Pseudolabrys sp.]